MWTNKIPSTLNYLCLFYHKIFKFEQIFYTISKLPSCSSSQIFFSIPPLYPVNFPSSPPPDGMARQSAADSSPLPAPPPAPTFSSFPAPPPFFSQSPRNSKIHHTEFPAKSARPPSETPSPSAPISDYQFLSSPLKVLI